MTVHLGDLVAPLVDGQLDHNARDSALAHLAHCPGCQLEVAAQRRLKALLTGLGEPELPDSAVRRLLGLPSSVSDPSAFLTASGTGAAASSAAPGPGLAARGGLGEGSVFARQPVFPSARAGVLSGGPVTRRGGFSFPSFPVGLAGLRAASAPVTGPEPALPPAFVAASPKAPAGPSEKQAQPRPPVRPERHWTARTLLGASAVVVLSVGGGTVVMAGRTPAAPATPTISPSSTTTVATVAVSGETPLVVLPTATPTGGPVLLTSVSTAFGR